MSALDTQADLPHIPSLPPLEMPTSSFLTSSETTDSPSPALSDVPAEPFDGNSADRNSPTPSMLAPPTGLRKSISVDSFIQHKLAPGKATRTRVNAPGPYLLAASEGVTRESSPHHQHFPSTSSSYSRSGQDHYISRHSVSTRQRGISIGAVSTENYTTAYEDSDGERSEDLRRNAGKGKSVSRQTVPEGELTLPSRLPNILTASTAAPEPIVPERSSSLVHKLTKPRSLMSVNTHLVPPPKYSNHRPEVTIAVIGTRGCNKTSVIRKGLKAYGLSEAKSQHDPESSTSSIQYTLRVGKIPHGGNVPDSILRVMEIDLLPSDDMENRLSRLCASALAINGTVFCFDVSDLISFTRIESIIRALDRFKLPSIVLACKSGSEHRVNLDVASSVLSPLDVGLVDITTLNDQGKTRLRDAFELILKLASKANDRSTPRNPASPALVSNPGPAPWDISRADSATPTASSTMQAAQTQPQGQSSASGSPRLPPATRESSHSPPARARSMSDLLSEQDARRRDSRERKDSQWEKSSYLTSESASNGRKEESPQPTPPVRAPPWVSIDDLLDKLLFVGVSDDDPVFVNHFFLTYRRFSTPRSILLAMQKRMRSLDQPTGDPMFACFAQMKICCLLDSWIRTYRDDFAVPGTAGAFSALIKSILGKTYLLHYGSEFIPFMEILPTLCDRDAFWAIKVEAPLDDSDEDASSIAEPPPEILESPSLSSISSHSLPTPPEPRNPAPAPAPPPPSTRERKSSLPLGRLSAKDNFPPGFKEVLNKLKGNASKLERWSAAEIAQEINRVQCDYFLKIQPRHWLQHVFAHGKKQKALKMDTITHFHWVSNHIGQWATSIILSYDKPKARARQIEKFADVANRLRIENNYSGLRAIVAGINGATYDGDLSIEMYRAKNPTSWKALQSFDQLLQSVRSHQKYRMALRNTKGACIPALEIHLSDLIRAHEGNPDFHDDDPAKIHWAKFNMMGRFIDTISQCQKACIDTRAYYQQANFDIYKSFCIETPHDLLSPDMQTARHPPPDLDGNLDARGLDLSRSIPRDSLQHAVRDGSGPLFKKIFFW
ncbi:hypothetical protein QCA50_001821 [Cerrena zonata]|uniref:Uncharacterized protein n=1 Tax=Cerrena zonata TaxID=2478898 RepID=A0AAW0GS13_9APHY